MTSAVVLAPIVRQRFTDGKRELVLLGADEAAARKRIAGYFPADRETEWRHLGAETVYPCPGCGVPNAAPGPCERCSTTSTKSPLSTPERSAP